MAENPVDFNYFLGRKYALLQQQADAGTKNANTGAVTGAASANLNNVTAALAPAQSASAIAEAAARTNLNNQQASVVVPESQARVRNVNAETDLSGTQNKVLTRTSLTPLSTLFGPQASSLGTSSALGSVFGSQFRAPRLQDYDRERGGLNASGLDYVNGF